MAQLTDFEFPKELDAAIHTVLSRSDERIFACHLEKSEDIVALSQWFERYFLRNRGTLHLMIAPETLVAGVDRDLRDFESSAGG